MTALFRPLARLLLWLTTVAIPVFIAACYGAPYRYSKTGKVIDAESEDGIDGIQVTCVEGDYETSMAYTGPDGVFWLSYDAPCDALRIEDVDGEDHGGVYLPRTVPFDEDCAELTVELHH